MHGQTQKIENSQATSSINELCSDRKSAMAKAFMATASKENTIPTGSIVRGVIAAAAQTWSVDMGLVQSLQHCVDLVQGLHAEDFIL